jgi:branched-chain amino acid transport system ATP-binding protein
VSIPDEPGHTALLEARQLVRAYDGRTVVDHADVSADAGRITVIIGPNGAGKTTLFNAVAGAEQPNQGHVLLNGRDITHLDSDARARLGLARTFQQSTVFSSLTVEENLRVGAENRHHNGTLRGLVGLPDRDSLSAAAIVERALTDVGLRSLRHMQAGRLPTGTLRLVELARALCTQPVALLLDEPASGLDDSETEELHQLLHRLAARGLALLLIEHDLDLVREAADFVYVMAAGRIIASGPPEELIRRPDVRAVVLGIPT